jgi:hypothetical protein
MATINFTKQNFNFIRPYSKQGVVYDSRNIFVFKGGTANTLNTIFPFPTDFIPSTNSTTADSLRVSSPNTFLFNRSYYRYTTTNGLWRLNPSTGDAGSTILGPGTLIYYRQGSLNTQNIRGARIASEAMVERYYQGNTIINNKYLSTLPTSRVSSGTIQGSYIYRQQRTLPSGIDVYPTGDNGRTTYQIKYQGPVNTQLIDILDPSLLFTADTDAQNYFNRANITDRMAKINISEFCLGLKNLNVWDKFKNIWILKSGYNYDGRDGFGASDYKNFYDLKNITFSGSGNGTIIKSLSGYKPLANIPSNDFLTFTNDPIIFTGNWTSMFLLQNYTGTPVNFEILFSNEGYESSGFRMGYPAVKEFTLWAGQSVPPGTPSFNAVETNVHSTPYSFITAGVKTNLINSGMATVLVDNKNKIQSTGYYYDSSRPITTLSAPAGGTYSFPNNIAFFGLSYEDLSNYHSGIRDLAKNTIYNNLNF